MSELRSKIFGKTKICIPLVLIKKWNLKDGDYILWTSKDNFVIVKPAKLSVYE